MALLTTFLSCKRNEKVAEDNYSNPKDSTEASVDTVGPDSDSTNTGTNGTTGAVGESSTGSGSDGTTQKGNSNVRTDSVTSNKKGR